MDKTWLDDSGAFLFGKHEGELAEDVAKEDPGYIKWILQSVDDISEEDSTTLDALLRYRGRF